MKRWSLRAAYVGATLATALATLSAEPALAHIVVRPDLVEQGELAELQIELSPLRPGAPPTSLELEGAGIEVLSTRLEGVVGAETRWLARVRAEAGPGVVPIVLRALYADGRSVEVDQRLTVVPAPKRAGFPWPAALVGVLLAVAFAASAVLLTRRRA